MFVTFCNGLVWPPFNPLSPLRAGRFQMDARDSEDLADYAQRLYAKKKAQELLLAGRTAAAEVRARAQSRGGDE